MKHEQSEEKSLVLDQNQQISLITGLLEADLAIAAMLFGVLGFIYAVYVNFASPKLPNTPVRDMQVPVLPSPMIDPLIMVARWILLDLGLSVLLTSGCLFWFLCPKNSLLIGVSIGLL